MRCIRPMYIKKFKCDGKSCGSRCCKGWRIVVDFETYQKYNSISDEQQRQDILSKLEQMDDSKYFVKMLDNFNCPFLDDDSLCKIQKRHGEEYLTAICDSYPRVTYRLDEVLEQSLTLTCPIAAKLILLSTEPIEFEFAEIDELRATFDWRHKINMSTNDAIGLQMAAISILQDRRLSMDQRLFELCILLKDDDNLKIDNNFSVQKHAQIMIDIFCEMYNANMDEAKKLNLQSIYISYRQIIFDRLTNAYSNIFENYMVNEFFMRCYPFAFDGDDIWTNCRIFVIGVKAMEFAVILTAISKNGIVNTEEFLTMIDAVNEKLDHNRGGMKAIRNLAENLSDFHLFTNSMLNLM